MISVQIQRTADGSSTLYLPDLEEHYHSVKGAKEEASHVYVHTAFDACVKESVNVLEMGFGTGLNAFLTLLASQSRNGKIYYTALEAYPLPLDIIERLRYPETIEPAASGLFLKLHEAGWNVWEQITPSFHLLKIKADLLKYDFHDNKYDVVYYDAFAPEKQPELWDESVFSRIYDVLFPGGILSTYCAKGEVRRRLQRCGFLVERLQGPPGGKREILRAVKPFV